MAFFHTIGPNPDLAIIYRNLIAAEGGFSRAGSAGRAQGTRDLLALLMARYDALSRQTAFNSAKLIRREIEATRKRPPRTLALEGAVLSVPLSTSLPSGAVGVGDLDKLDHDAPYWIIQEIGTAREAYGIKIPSQKSTFFGGPRKVVPGFFQPGDARPAPDQFRVHPFFQQEPYRKGMPALNVHREIEPRRFMERGTEIAVAQHSRSARAIDRDILRRLAAV